MTPGNGPTNDPNQNYSPQNDWRAQRAAWRAQHPSRSRATAGIALLVLGVVFLLANLGFFYAGDVGRFWPVLLIVAGAVRALGYGRFGYGRPRLLVGGGLMVVGGMLLAKNFGFLHGNVWSIIWPVMLIFGGVASLFRQSFGYGTPGACAWTPNPRPDLPSNSGSSSSNVG
jgi:hypothetical protein